MSSRPNALCHAQVPSGAIFERSDVAARAAECHAVPQSAMPADQSKSSKTNPPLTDQQRAVARMLVQGLRTNRIAHLLGLNRHTIPRWRRDPRVIAEMDRLRKLAERAVALAVLSPVASSKAASPPQPAAPPPDHAPQRQLSPFAKRVLELSRAGITPYKNAAEYHRQLREFAE